MLDDELGVGPLGQDVEQGGRSAEVEARESDSLRLEVVLQSLLADFELRQELLKHLEAVLVVAGLHHVCDVDGALLKVLELGIEAIEALRVFRELHADVRAPDEDGLKRAPLLLDVRPRYQNGVHRPELLLPAGDDLQELLVTLDVLPGAHVLQSQVVALQGFLDYFVVHHLADLSLGERHKGQGQTGPRLVNLLQGLLDHELLLGTVDNVGDLVYAGVQL